MVLHSLCQRSGGCALRRTTAMTTKAHYHYVRTWYPNAKPVLGCSSSRPYKHSAPQASSSTCSPALQAALSSTSCSQLSEVVVIPHHFPTARRLLGQKTLRGYGCAQRRASLSRGACASSVRARARGPAWFSIFIACVRFAHTTEVLLAASCNGPPQPRPTAGDRNLLSLPGQRWYQGKVYRNSELRPDNGLASQIRLPTHRAIVFVLR